MKARVPGPGADLRLLLYGVMALVAATFLLRPIKDPDFFWHLKNGDWIRQHGALPDRDPFNYFNESFPVERQNFTLTASWLSEVLYSLIYDLAGFPGILALRFLLALLLVLLLTRLRRGDQVVHAALVLATLLLFCRMYHFERPQLFSFAFFAALLALLERERSAPTPPSGWRSLLQLPLLMLLWSNMHGGHAIGQVTILVFIVLEGAKFLHPSLRPADRGRYRRLLIAGGAGLAASLVNPNSYYAIGMTLGPTPQNTEYLSSLEFFEQEPLVAIFWGALALCALALLASRREPDITRIALLAGVGYEAFSHVRYIPLFMIAALPVIGARLSAERSLRWGRRLLAAGAVALAAFSIRNDLPSAERLRQEQRLIEGLYPVRAADFVLANAPRGNLYNTYLWGGYLIWRLGPERKVFVDGRGMVPEVSFPCEAINMAYATRGDSLPLWQRLLRQYGVGYLIIPRIESLGRVKFEDVASLRAALVETPEWIPVYADETSLVFVRNVPEHREIIRRHAIPTGRLRKG